LNAYSVSPSTELRRWYGHDPTRFHAFRGRYLTELAAAGLIEPLPEGSATEEKPDIDGDGTEQWPFDPLGTRRAVVEAARGRLADAESCNDAHDGRCLAQPSHHGGLSNCADRRSEQQRR